MLTILSHEMVDNAGSTMIKACTVTRSAEARSSRSFVKVSRASNLATETILRFRSFWKLVTRTAVSSLRRIYSASCSTNLLDVKANLTRAERGISWSSSSSFWACCRLLQFFGEVTSVVCPVAREGWLSVVGATHSGTTESSWPRQVELLLRRQESERKYQTEVSYFDQWSQRSLFVKENNNSNSNKKQHSNNLQPTIEPR